MNFRNVRVSELYEQVRPWCHPDYPFLHACYSPESRMPAIDYTPFVATCLQNEQYAAVSELLGFLINGESMRDTVVSDWTKTRSITWLGLPETAVYEIHAIGLLVSRQAIDRSINKDSLAYFASRLIATRLSLHQAIIDADHRGPSRSSSTHSDAAGDQAADEGGSDNDADDGAGTLLATKISLAYGLRQWQDGRSKGALTAFPAQEISVLNLTAAGTDLPKIWDDTVAELGSKTTATSASRTGRMVAKKSDPVWLRISEFGLPYPPFRLGSGEMLMDVSWEEAVDLGVVGAQESSVAAIPRIVSDGRTPDFSWAERFVLKPEYLLPLEAPFAEESAVIERLAAIPPMTRLVIVDYFGRDWAQGKMQTQMGYTEREYGCCSDWNLHYIRWLDFFQPPTNVANIPHSLKKDDIRVRLEAAGIRTKKSASRASLLEMAGQNPALLSAILAELCPEACVPKEEWKFPLEAWLSRYGRSLEAAGEIYKSLLLEQLSRKHGWEA